MAGGVGARINPVLVKVVVNGLSRIVNRATAQAAEAASYGILPTDVTSFTAQIAAIKLADQQQEQARAQAPQTK